MNDSIYSEAAMSAPVHWTQIPPQAAKRLALPDPDIVGPVNSLGEPCPWPWEPQMLEGMPMGQYHCSFCGDMEVAGMQHLDWSGDPEFNEGYEEASLSRQ